MNHFTKAVINGDVDQFGSRTRVYRTSTVVRGVITHALEPKRFVVDHGIPTQSLANAFKKAGVRREQFPLDSWNSIVMTVKPLIRK